MTKPLLLAVLVAPLVACSYDLGLPPGAGSGREGGRFGGRVHHHRRRSREASLDAAPSVLRLRVDAPPPSGSEPRAASPSRPVSSSPTLLRELGDQPGKRGALGAPGPRRVLDRRSRRSLPRRADRRARGGAGLHRSRARGLRRSAPRSPVADDPAAGAAPRIWPPVGLSATAGLWCLVRREGDRRDLRDAEVDARADRRLRATLSLGVEGVDPPAVSRSSHGRAAARLRHAVPVAPCPAKMPVRRADRRPRSASAREGGSRPPEHPQARVRRRARSPSGSRVCPGCSMLILASSVAAPRLPCSGRSAARGSTSRRPPPHPIHFRALIGAVALDGRFSLDGELVFDRHGGSERALDVRGQDGPADGARGPERGAGRSDRSPRPGRGVGRGSERRRRARRS